MSTISVSTWALHRALGTTFWDTPEDPVKRRAETYGPGGLSLLDVPARLAAIGIGTMEICHFHLPARDNDYLRALRAALDAAGVRLFSLLIDAGDITHPEHGERDLEWVGGWIDTAGALGAERARVIAGKQEPTAAALARSRAGLRRLVERAEPHRVRVMTENWFGLLSGPDPVHALLDGLDGAVGLCLDWGNWSGPTRYADLAAIAPRAESCHAKTRFLQPDLLDREDLRRCLDLMQNAGFAGPCTLVDGGPGDDEWEGLALQRDALRSYTGNLMVH